MNKYPRIFSLLALAGAALWAGAAQDAGVSIEAKDASGQSTGIVAVNLNTKIKFSSTGMEVYDGQTQIASFAYADCAKVTFLSTESGIEAVGNEAALTLLTNPAYDQLEFSGFDGIPAQLAIYSVNGQRMAYVSAWQGQPVDVSRLPQGLYLLTVNNSTFKFIKK